MVKSPPVSSRSLSPATPSTERSPPRIRAYRFVDFDRYLQFVLWHVRELEIHGPVRACHLNLDLLCLLHVLAVDMNRNLFRIAAYHAEVALVQVQAKTRAAGQVRLKTLMLEFRRFLRGLAERYRAKQQRNSEQP